ncbi:MAG: LVIVD repeat-containing protein, partial [Candidatus Heimdallarchaeaceae archaeon]
TIDHARDVFVSGIYCYIADEDGGVQIINVNNPASPTNVSAINTGGYVYGVYVEGNTLCIADYFSKFFVYDVTNPATPIHRGNITLNNNAYDLSVDGNIAYVADGYSGLLAIDITDPTDPVILDTYFSGDYVKDAKFEDDKVYIADATAGVVVIDASDPSDLTLIGSYDTWNWPEGLFVKDDMVYVADYMGGLLVLDHNGHESPMYAQSTNLVLISTDAQITKAKMTLQNYSTLWSGMAVGMYLSADGGVNWQAVDNGAETALTHPGTDLRFRLILVNFNDVNATWVSELTVEYTTKLNSISLDSPSYDAYIADNTPTLSWSPITGADSYILQVDDAPDFVAQIVNASVSGSAENYTTTTLPDGFYYWRILGIDSSGYPGEWSDTWNFTIDTTDPVVVGEPDFDFNEGETGHNVNWTITELNVAYFTVYLDETAVPLGLLTFDGTTLWISTDGLGTGLHNYTLEVLDDAGNTGTDVVYVDVNIVVGEFKPVMVVLPLLTVIGICSILISKRRK